MSTTTSHSSPRQARLAEIARHGSCSIEWSPGVWVTPAESQRRSRALRAKSAR